MISRVFLLCALLAGTSRLAAADADNQLTLELKAGAEHPRNSEGTFAALRSGRIIFCYSQFSGGASDFSPCRIAEIASDDEGRTWSEPRALFPEAAKTMEMSPSLLRLVSGKLALFSLIKRGTLDCRPYLRISNDDGATWSAPRSLIPAPGYFVLNDDRVIQTKTGRLIMPLGFHRGRKAVDDGSDGNDHRALDLWYYSDDEGTTWKESATWWTIPVASETGLQEPGVVELADGSLFSWARTDQGCQYGFRSHDNGVTWTAPQPTLLRSPAAPASIKRLPNSDDLLAVFNDHSGQFPFVFTPRTYAGRTPLVAAISADGGATWRTAKLIENDPEMDYCYIAIHYVGDSVLLSYFGNSRNPSKPSVQYIRRINAAWLTAPFDALAVRATKVLHEVMGQEESWVKIHAAEALVIGGEAIPIREEFLKKVPDVNSLPYRVGVWRVLANTSPTAAERAHCVEEVEKIFLNPASTDRSQALETLCKLRCQVKGQTLELVRAIAKDEKAPLRGLAFWALRLDNDPAGLEGLCNFVRSPKEGDRLIGAYAFRLLRESDPAALRLLAQAATAEPTGSKARAYLLSAAFALNADPAQRPAWRAALEKILAEGMVDARFEVANGLVQQVHTADLPKYGPLLAETGNDTKIGAAMTILSVRARE